MIEILEWGSGGSTVYFSKFLDILGANYKWISMEYNKKWAEIIKNSTKENKNIEIKLFDVGNDQTKQVETNMDDYVNYPATLDKKFDFILVDGRKRRRCVLEAKKIVSNDGIIILHNAERTYYHSALTGGSFISERFWIYSNWFTMNYNESV